MARGALALLVALATTSCFFGKAIETAQAAVVTFHADYNEGGYAAIYAAADDTFHNGTSQAGFVDYLSAVRRKLGKQVSSQMGRWNVHKGPLTTRVNLTFASHFEGGDAREDFIWTIVGDQARLVGYTINSTALVLK